MILTDTNDRVEYQVVTMATMTHFEEAINDAISRGWQPVGGMTIEKFRDQLGYDKSQYHQAMTRTK